MDYDRTKIASAYDAARTINPARLKVWEDRYLAHVPKGAVKDVLDLGCGTGRFSQSLADLYGARVVGVDPSETMLAQARAKSPTLTFLPGSGEALPVADAAFDLVFLSLVYHHFLDHAQVGRESARVLRPGGWVIVRTPTMDSDAYYAFEKFFPTYKSLASQTIPRRAPLRAVFENAGLKEIANEVIPHQIADDWADFQRKTALRADSFLARLSDAEFESGMTALNAYVAAGGGPLDPLTEPIDLFVFQKPAETLHFPSLVQKHWPAP
jgi:ubiquinone/menaquinone biosynthesis C-methylase UbiE